MDLIAIAALILVGFVGCAEFGSVLFVHPAIRKLSDDGQLVMEKGLLRTFGRVMPIGMTAAPILVGLLASLSPSGWHIASVVCLTVALVITIAVNVPINLRTGRIRTASAPEGFIAMRRRWDRFQALRGGLQFAGFALLSVGIVLS